METTQKLCIFGNYGWTPLGIHQDDRGNNVIHFHLGPGEKTMYTWDEQEYNAITDSKQNNHEIDPLLPLADEYKFGTGDLYYMPWNKYHIGKSDEFSIGITFWFCNPTKSELVNSIFNTFLKQYVDEKNKDIIPLQKNHLIEDTALQDMFTIFKKDSGLFDRSLNEFFKVIYQEYKNCLISNSG